MVLATVTIKWKLYIVGIKPFENFQFEILLYALYLANMERQVTYLVQNSQRNMMDTT